MRELFSGRRGAAAAGLLVAEFISATQALVVVTIMPRVVADLNGLALYGLAFGVYLAASFVLIPFAGPWSDRYGTRRVLTAALALLAAGMALAGIARTMPLFLAARAIEGAGGGLDYAAAFTAIVKMFSEEQRARMFSLISTTWVVPSIVGPSLGAFVAIRFGWRWDFFGFIPLVAVTAALLLPALEGARSHAPVDAFGSLRLLFSRATLRLQGRHVTFICSALLNAAFFGADAYVALALTTVRGLPLTAAGICITLGALGWSLLAIVQPQLLERFGARIVVTVAAIVIATATAGLIFIALTAPIWVAFAAWFFAGAGMGLAYPTLSLVSVANVAKGNEGVISSAMLLAGMFGMTIGVSIGGIPIAVAQRLHLALSQATAVTFTIAICAALTLALASTRLQGRNLPLSSRS